MYLRQTGPLLREYEDETDEFLRILDEHPESQSENRKKEEAKYRKIFQFRDYPTDSEPKKRTWEDIDK